MPRFFLEACLDPAADTLQLAGADFHHIRDVLRLGPGDELIVCDGTRSDLRCRIRRFTAAAVELTVEERQANHTEPSYRAILYQGLAKGDKMDTIVQKAVELGVFKIVPVICRRSVARPDENSLDRKLARWNRIAAEAAKQCGRGQQPKVARPLEFAAAVGAAATADICLIPWENERGRSLRQELETAAADKPQPEISLLIGPEGGFAAEETGLAFAAGIRPVTLGRRILRTETAGAAALAMLIYRFNDF
ncbi:MAG TPA: 16S rRNA (uracil(1498)-N(3))-methyltransferase [Clostridiales bacterium]|nr:16S rRNA (uracil(1498)-N(3))-methyltransferase [Clostridiales bacterium]